MNDLWVVAGCACARLCCLLPVLVQAHAVAATSKLSGTKQPKQAISTDPTCSTQHIAAPPRPQHAKIRPNPDVQGRAASHAAAAVGLLKPPRLQLRLPYQRRPLPCYHLTATPGIP